MDVNVSDLKSGDKDAFNAVFYSFYSPVYDYLMSKTDNSYFAEEVTQLTFIKVWEKRNQLAVDIDIGAQVFRIAKTVFIDQLRTRYRKKNRPDLVTEEELSEYTDNQLVHNISYKDSYKRLNRILDMLPPARKQVFELSRLSGFSHKEIAEMLQISTKTVENHITKALKQIKPLWNATILIVAIFLQR